MRCLSLPILLRPVSLRQVVLAISWLMISEIGRSVLCYAAAVDPQESPCSGSRQLFFRVSSDKTTQRTSATHNETLLDLSEKLTMLSQVVRDVQNDYRRRRGLFCSVKERSPVVKTCKSLENETSTDWDTEMSHLLCKTYHGLDQVNERRERALDRETDYTHTVVESRTFKKSFENIDSNSVCGLRPIRCLIFNAMAQFPGEWERCYQRIQTCRTTSTTTTRRRKTTTKVRRAERSQTSNRAEMFKRNCKRIDSIAKSVDQLNRNFASLMEERFDH